MEDGTGDSPTQASTLTGAGAVLAGRYRIRARLGDHPNAITVYDVGVLDGVP